jgi:hypothetical protein
LAGLAALSAWEYPKLFEGEKSRHKAGQTVKETVDVQVSYWLWRLSIERHDCKNKPWNLKLGTYF